MSVYAEYLPHVFSWYAVVDDETAAKIASFLILAPFPGNAHDGSSFAIVGGRYAFGEWERGVWLSGASHDRVVASKRWPRIEWHPTVTHAATGE